MSSRRLTILSIGLFGIGVATFSFQTAHATPSPPIRFHAFNKIPCLLTVLGPRLAVTQYSCLTKNFNGSIMEPRLGSLKIVVHPKIADRPDYQAVPPEYDVAFLIMEEDRFPGESKKLSGEENLTALRAAALDSREAPIEYPAQEGTWLGTPANPNGFSAKVEGLTERDSGATLMDESGHPVGIYLYTGEHDKQDSMETKVTKEEKKRFFLFNSDIGKELQLIVATKSPEAVKGILADDLLFDGLIRTRIYRRLAGPANPFYSLGKQLSELDESIVKPVETIFQSEQENKSVLIVGQAGSLADFVFARLAARGNAQTPKRIDLEINLNSIVAGNIHVGEVEKAYEQKIKIPSENPNLFIYVRDLNTLIGLGSHEGNKMGVEGMFANDMRNGAIRLIAVLDPINYEQIRHSDRSYLLDAFAAEIRLPVPSETEVLSMAKRAATLIYPRLALSDSDFRQLEELASIQLPSLQEPDRFLRVFKQLASDLQVSGNSEPTATPISPSLDDLTQAVMKVAFAPSWLVKGDYSVLDQLDQRLSELMSGAAVDAREKIVRLAQGNYIAGRGGRKPIATVLLAGSTGAGKSYLAKQLGIALKTKLITFDMTKYQNKEEASELTEQLSLALDSNPYGIFLFEEIDKAYPPILDQLYFLMDEGRFLDLHQRPHYAGGAFVLMTTNAAEPEILKYAKDGFLEHPTPESDADLQQAVHHSLFSTFRPSFLNRFDEEAIFKPMTFTEAKAVTQHLVNKKKEEQAHFNNLLITIDDQVIAQIAKKGNDPESGARSLERLVDTIVNSAIAKVRLKAGPRPKNQPISLSISLLSSTEGKLKVECGNQNWEYTILAVKEK